MVLRFRRFKSTRELSADHPCEMSARTRTVLEFVLKIRRQGKVHKDFRAMILMLPTTLTRRKAVKTILSKLFILCIPNVIKSRFADCVVVVTVINKVHDSTPGLMRPEGLTDS